MSAYTYRLFSVLNDRGRGLSAGDLLRSYTLEKLEFHSSYQIQAEQRWDEILSDTDAHVEKYLRAEYTSIKYERPGQRTLFDDYVKSVLQPPNPFDPVAYVNTIQVLESDARIYRCLIDGDWPYSSSNIGQWDKQRLYLLINFLKHTLCIPLLMAGVNHLSEQQFAQLVHTIELFCFRYITVCRTHPGKLAELYHKECEAVRTSNGNYNLAAFRSKLEALILADTPDSVFEAQLINQLVYGSRSANQALKYFLTTLEHYFDWFSTGANQANRYASKIAVYDLQAIEIEHIYPQNPQVLEPTLDAVKHRIGNLTFWGPNDNKAASNYPFSMKLPFYRTSNVRLNRELFQFSSWTSSEYSQRKQNLTQCALSVFRL